MVIKGDTWPKVLKEITGQEPKYVKNSDKKTDKETAKQFLDRIKHKGTKAKAKSKTGPKPKAETLKDA